MNIVKFEAIKPSFSNARTIQCLTLQDVTVGGFEYPKNLANPNSLAYVLAQRRKLQRHPDRYTGSYIGRNLKGYMKTNEWQIADELPFANDTARSELQKLQEEGIRVDPNRALGIFGLVVSNELPYDEQLEIGGRFLDLATERAHDMGMQAIKIVFHDNDPLLKTAQDDHEFMFTGAIGEAVGAPGLTQRLYRKSLRKPLDL